MTPKLDAHLIARQIFRALLKSVPSIGPALEELFFGTYDKIRSTEAQQRVTRIVEELTEEIRELYDTGLTGEDLQSRINSLLSSRHKTLEIISKGIKKDYFEPIANYLLTISNEIRKEDPLGFDIFALPITLRPGNLIVDGILPFTSIPQRKIVIHGKPACGKTTAIKRILITAKDQPKLIPIQLSTGDIATPKNVRDATCLSLGLSPHEMFTVLEKRGLFLYVFDGLNEYPDIERLSRDIYLLSNSLINSRFLVTCRSHEYKSQAELKLRGFYPLEIKDLSWADQQKFFKDKVTNQSKRKKLFGTFKQEPLLQQVCSNQFIFLMAVEFIPKEKIPPRISSDFYELFLHRFVESWEKRTGKKSTNLESRRKFLEEIAALITCSPGSKATIEENELKGKHELRQIIKDMGVTDVDKVLVEVLDGLYYNGLLEKRGKDVKFFQETFQEFLLASWLIQKGVFPRDLTRNERGYLQYHEVEISKLSERFYLELSGIQEHIRSP